MRDFQKEKKKTGYLLARKRSACNVRVRASSICVAEVVRLNAKRRSDVQRRFRACSPSPLVRDSVLLLLTMAPAAGRT